MCGGGGGGVYACLRVCARACVSSSSSSSSSHVLLLLLLLLLLLAWFPEHAPHGPSTKRRHLMFSRAAVEHARLGFPFHFPPFTCSCKFTGSITMIVCSVTSPGKPVQNCHDYFHVHGQSGNRDLAETALQSSSVAARGLHLA